jgi:hypothetical protein
LGRRERVADMTQFIEFAEEWYWEHLTELPNAHEYAVLR